jgi:dimethylargininase
MRAVEASPAVPALIALTREVSPSLARCELTHVPRVPIDAARAAAQHRAYCDALAALGCEVLALPPDPDLPDSVFVEDVALVVDEVAVALRPGAASRRAEVRAVATALAEHRPLSRIVPPGTVDGGDLLRIGRTVYAGASGRTDADGIAQLAAALTPCGYEVRPVPVRGCLHLKSAVTLVGPSLLLGNRAWVDAGAFGRAEWVDVHPEEPGAGNALRVGDTVLYADSHPRTAERLLARGVAVRTLDVSELEKAEGAVTCCSILFAPPRARRA